MKMNKKPRIAFSLLQTLLPDEDRLGLIRDFEFLYENMQKERGKIFAWFWIWGQVFKSVPGLIAAGIYWRYFMYRNYVKMAFRNIMNHKGFTFINVSGLILGITCFLLIFLWIQDETSYDKHHEKADRIYRIRVSALFNDNEIDLAETTPLLAGTLVREFPEVEQAARFYNVWSDVLFTYEDKSFSEKGFVFADSTIFDVFTIPLVRGDAETALNKPYTMVISESIADKYFGSEDPIGKTLNNNDRFDFEITGVMKDMPENSHFHFNMLGSFCSHPYSRDQIWISNNCHSYIVLQENYPPENLEAKFPALIEKYIGPQVEQVLGLTIEQFNESGQRFGYFLQKLTDIHLHSNLQFELEANGDVRYVYLFSIAALFLLLIACINYVNLATARTANRAKEVGVRKVLGSQKRQLTAQFLSESVILAAATLILSLIFVQMLLPVFNELSGKALSINYGSNFLYLLTAAGIIFTVGILSGLYPALVLASFKPVNVLRGKFSKGARSSYIRSGLVTVQFSISIILLIGTFIVFDQLQFISDKKLGMNKDNILILNRTDTLGDQWEAFKNELSKNPNIISSAASNTVPGRIIGDRLYKPADNTDRNILLWHIDAGPDFFETYEIELLSGRNFHKTIGQDSNSIILNENAAKLLGWEDPIGQSLYSGDNVEYEVVGVIKNFHFESLHREIRPIAIRSLPGSPALMSVKIRPENYRETIGSIEETWKSLSTDQPYEYYFLDDSFNNLYKSEMLTSKLFSIFSMLTIYVACLGLFGLSAFIIQQRTKEIGIRKVLGATSSNIVVLLSGEFTKWVIIANIIAWPVAYYSMQNWLNDFAYRTSIGFGNFIFAALLVLLLALVTVTSLSVRSARANPVDSIRYE